MNIEEVREYCFSLSFATERYPFGPDTLAIEIGGRLFCLMTLGGQTAGKLQRKYSHNWV